MSANFFKPILQRFLSLILTLFLAFFWVILSATPAFAESVSYPYADLSNHDFSNTDLTGSKFVAAQMPGANFQGANLTNAIFTKGVLRNANLSGANLTNAFVDTVMLDNANLTNAIFTGAIMTRSRFEGTIISGADFTDAIIDSYQLTLLCKKAEGINPVTGVSTRESLGGC